MGDDPSITSIKASFIRSQVRSLSAPLRPSTTWRDLRPPESGEENRLSDKVVQDIVNKVNDTIRRHNRLVFSAPSQRHVAEQIETLYWNQVTVEDEGEEHHQSGSSFLDPAAVIVKRDAELTETDTIQSLPESYEDVHRHPGHVPDDGLAARYATLRTRLLELSRRRDEKKAQLARYRRLQDLLRPLEEPQTTVQPNLVTRDGELGRELDRMRVLLARIMGRVAGTNENVKTGNDNNRASSRVSDTSLPQRHEAALTDEQKLARLMELT